VAVQLLVIDRSGSIEFAGAGRLFLCPSSNIYQVDSYTRTHARGHSLAPVSAHRQVCCPWVCGYCLTIAIFIYDVYELLVPLVLPKFDCLYAMKY